MEEERNEVSLMALFTHIVLLHFCAFSSNLNWNINLLLSSSYVVQRCLCAIFSSEIFYTMKIGYKVRQTTPHCPTQGTLGLQIHISNFSPLVRNNLVLIFAQTK